MCDKNFGVWLTDVNGIATYTRVKCNIEHQAGMCQYIDHKSGCMVMQILVETVTVDSRGCVKEKP